MSGIQGPFRGCLTFLLTAAVAMSAQGVEPLVAGPLSHEQLAALQSEAETAFDHGVKLQGADPVNANDEFALAAQKYQLLADAQPNSGPLRFNLANAYLHSGQVGPAIANYLQAEKLMPGDARVTTGLQAARTLVGTPNKPETESLAANLAGWNQKIPLNTRLWIGIAAWMTLWAAVALAMFWPSRRWRAVCLPALFVAAVAAASVGYQRYAMQGPQRGVVTAAQATVRQGNGDGFGPQFSEPLTAGTEFAVADRSGDWIKIDLADGRWGWLNDRDAAVIE